MASNPLARERLESVELDEEAAEAPMATFEVDAAPPRGGERGGTMSMRSAAAVLMTWSTSSSNVMYPWTFGVLGVGVGPLLMVCVFFATYRATSMVVEAALECRAVTLGDVGVHLAGARGRAVLEGAQLLFQQLFLPVAIALSVDATRAVLRDAPWWQCNVRVVAVFAAAAFAISQAARRLGHVVALAHASILGIAIQTAALLYFCASRDLPTGDGLAPGAPWRWAPRGAWYDVCAALGVFVPHLQSGASCSSSAATAAVGLLVPARLRRRRDDARDGGAGAHARGAPALLFF